MFRYLKNLFVSEKKVKLNLRSPEEKLLLRLKPYEQQVYRIQDIIVWKDLHLSTLCIIVVHFLFWFISYFEWRFLGFLFTVLSIIFMHDLWTNHVWPEIRVEDSSKKEEMDFCPPEGVLSLPELSHYATEIQALIMKQYERIKYLRTFQPTFFCICSTAVWLFIAGIGGVISGMVLIYILIMMLLTLPGAYIHLVTPEQKQLMMDVINSICFVLLPPENIKNVDDYLPNTSQENMEILIKAGANTTDLSTPSSDSSIGDMIPEYDETSVDTVYSFGLPQIEKDNSETDSERETLSFKNTHFNGNSSSEEASLVRDLSFPDIESFSSLPLNSTGFTSTLSGVIYKTFPTLSGRIQFRATSEGVLPPTVQENSDSEDSEFEIIDENS